VLTGTWYRDGRVARLEDAAGVRGFIRLIDDWYEHGSRSPQQAWVVEWMAEGHDAMQRALVELDGVPAASKDQMATITEKANAVIDAGPPVEPARFGAGTTGLRSRAELRDLIELTSHAVQAAAGRVSDAARRKDDYAVMQINTSSLEAVGWLRALDDLMQNVVWQQQLTDVVRERISLEVDERLAAPGVAAQVLAEAAANRRVGQPYTYWTHALLSKGVWLPRSELKAFRWLAGKLLHHGPLSVVELRHWRVGQKPRWVWRAADAIFPPSLKEEREEQRNAYTDFLAGRDVAGSLNLTTALIEMEFLFFRLLRESHEEEDGDGSQLSGSV
jgi:hypothetical protein